MSGTNEHIQHIIGSLPKTPGVYQMKDQNSTIIYIGKAKNLKNRVSSYFTKIFARSGSKKHMIPHIADIDIILCNTEVEALILETNLIKQYTPKYNILMKDDKSLSYIAITTLPVGNILQVRNKNIPNATFFGPYTPGAHITESIKLLRRVFKIRACRIAFSTKNDQIIIADKAGKSIPCMDYYIGICPGPCLLQQKLLTTHQQHTQNALDFLSGKSQIIIANICNKMKQAALEMKFEQAGKWKQEKELLEGLLQKQMMQDVLPGNHDICASIVQSGRVFLALTRIRKGRIVGVFRFFASGNQDTEKEIILHLLMQKYLDTNTDIPQSLLLDFTPDDQAFLDFLLSQKIILTIAKNGNKKSLLDFTKNQAREYAYTTGMKAFAQKALTKKNMEHLLELLDYPVPKSGAITFECYDISHTNGHFTYGSRVVLRNGKTLPSAYRKYKIRSLVDGTIDDYASHSEVLFRRTTEAITHNNFPNLIIIDGGKGQLSAAIKGIKAALSTAPDIPMPAICALAEREEEIFTTKQSASIQLDPGSGELLVMQKIRDEAHRFALGANRAARKVAAQKNILEALPGFGPKTRKKLLSHVPSVDQIQSIDIHILQNILTSRQITTLRDHGII